VITANRTKGDPALTIWVDQKADMRTVIPALKIGADDGDEVCAAFLGEINPSVSNHLKTDKVAIFCTMLFICNRSIDGGRKLYAHLL
jgi:hypothetical protein